MGVTSCKLHRILPGGYDRRNRGTYVMRYRIKSDVPLMQRGMLNGALVANIPATNPRGEANDPLPAHGSQYDFSADFAGETEACSYADDFRFRRVNAEKTMADVDVIYTPLGPGEDALHRTQTDPLKRPVRWHWEQESYTKILDRDWLGRPVVNPCNRPFDRPPTIQATRGVHVGRFNVADQDTAISLSQKYDGAVNITQWDYFPTSKPARTVLCRYFRSGETITECPNSYVPCEMAFVYANDGEDWDINILNEGYGHYKEQQSQRYGYATVSADVTTATANIPLSNGVILEDSGGGAAIPGSVTNPGLSLKAGDIVPLLFTGSWAYGEPALDVSTGAPQYVRAKTDEGENVTEPVLLRSNGLKLPEGMQGTYTEVRGRREVVFGDLDALLSPAQ